MYIERLYCYKVGVFCRGGAGGPSHFVHGEDPSTSSRDGSTTYISTTYAFLHPLVLESAISTTYTLFPGDSAVSLHEIVYSLGTTLSTKTDRVRHYFEPPAAFTTLGATNGDPAIVEPRAGQSDHVRKPTDRNKSTTTKANSRSVN